MSPEEPDSHQAVTLPESSAVTSPVENPAPPPAEKQQSVEAATSNKVADPSQNIGTHGAVPPPPANLESWIFETYRLSDGAVKVELRRPVEAVGWGAWIMTIIKDLGPPLTGIASAVIAGLVFYYGNQFNERQINAQEAQAVTASKELDLKILSEFSQSLAELSSSDQKTRTLAAIKFLRYRGDALPAIKLALGVAQDDVRKGAVTVVAELFRSEAISHDALLKSLLEYFQSGNTYMRIGVLECFEELSSQLTTNEATTITNLLNLQLKTEANCSNQPAEDEVLRKAAVVLHLWPSLDSTNLLLRIAKNHTCQRAQIQAVDNLRAADRAVSPERCKTLVGDLQALIPGAAETLQQRLALTINSLKTAGCQ